MSKAGSASDDPVDRLAALWELRRQQVKDLTWRWFAWRIAVIVAVPTLAVLADYAGWLTLNTGRTIPVAVLLSVLAVMAIDAVRRKSFWATSYVVGVFMLSQAMLTGEARDVRQDARFRIALINACANANPASELAAQCHAALVWANYEPCDFGTTPEACRRELFRDAGWPLNETPIPPHGSGETLPLGR